MTGLPNPFQETKYSGANEDNKERNIFPILADHDRIDNLTRLILTLAVCVITKHGYIHVYVTLL